MPEQDYRKSLDIFVVENLSCSSRNVAQATVPPILDLEIRRINYTAGRVALVMF